MNIQTLYSEFLSSSGICTDSRVAAKNEIFFAIKGENYDGNKYARDAIDKGCKLAVIDDPSSALNEKFIVVGNTLLCLQELARYHRNKLNIPILAITGSNGKTTTKELIFHVLSRKFKTLSTQGNLNNHIGVPLTLLRIRDEEMAIIEMGANHPGEIDFLCRIALPDHGIITNIGKAHLEGFGGFEGVKKTKSELYRFLDEKGGIVFINGNNDILMDLSRTGKFRKIFYMNGPDPICDGYILENREYLRVAVHFREKKLLLETEMSITGAYNLENILAAACIGSHFKVSPEEIMAGLSTYKSKNNRSQYIATENNRIVLDAYNANPTSMAEALINFESVGNGKKILILGDMLEMGEYASEEHLTILRSVNSREYSAVFLVGKEFYALRESFPFYFFSSVEQLIEHFKSSPVKDSLILIKGSRGIALERTLDVL